MIHYINHNYKDNKIFPYYTWKDIQNMRQGKFNPEHWPSKGMDYFYCYYDETDSFIFRPSDRRVTYEGLLEILGISREENEEKDRQKNYIYSTDKEMFYTEAGFKEHLKDLAHELPVYRGTKVNFTHEEFVWIDGILELMEEQAEDVNNSKNPLYADFTKAEKTDLQKVIVEWLVKNKGQPTIFGVKDVEECETL